MSSLLSQENPLWYVFLYLLQPYLFLTVITDETRPVCERCLKADLECPGYKDTTFVSFGVSQTGPRRLSKEVAQAEKGTRPSSDLSIKRSITLWTSDDVCVSYARSYLPHTWKDPSLWQFSATNCVDSRALMEENLAQYACISLARAMFAYRFRQQKLLMQGVSLYRSVISILQRKLSLGGIEVYKQMLEVAIALRAFDVSSYDSRSTNAFQKV